MTYSAHVLQRFIERDHIRILGVEIKQALCMRGAGAIADGFSHHHRAQPCLTSVDRGSADAPAGSASDKNQRVDPLTQQPRHQIGAEETRRIFLDQEAVAFAEFKSRIDLHAVAVGLQGDNTLLLQRPDASVFQVGIVVYHRGEDDRNVPLMRDRSRVELCEGCLRITVGAADENLQLVNALSETR